MAQLLVGGYAGAVISDYRRRDFAGGLARLSEMIANVEDYRTDGGKVHERLLGEIGALYNRAGFFASHTGDIERSRRWQELALKANVRPKCFALHQLGYLKAMERSFHEAAQHEREAIASIRGAKEVGGYLQFFLPGEPALPFNENYGNDVSIDNASDGAAVMELQCYVYDILAAHPDPVRRELTVDSGGRDLARVYAWVLYAMEGQRDLAVEWVERAIERATRSNSDSDEDEFQEEDDESEEVRASSGLPEDVLERLGKEREWLLVSRDGTSPASVDPSVTQKP